MLPDAETLRQITDDLIAAVGWLTLLTRRDDVPADAQQMAREALAAVERASTRLLGLRPPPS